MQLYKIYYDRHWQPLAGLWCGTRAKLAWGGGGGEERERESEREKASAKESERERRRLVWSHRHSGPRQSMKVFKSTTPQKALGGGIPCSFLEPFARSWSHFVGIYRQKLTKSSKNDF